MTIEELKAEVEAATLRVAEARTALTGARDRLQAAVNEASGIIDHVLEFERRRGYGRNEKIVTIRILVQRVEKRWEDEFVAVGVRMLKDGSVGVQQESVRISGAKDLGPCIASSSEQEKSR